jgi:hypothetical protein
VRKKRIDMNLVVALVLIAGPWLAITRVLAASTRLTDPSAEAPARLAAKTVPWRPPPPNRVLPTRPRAEPG